MSEDKLTWHNEILPSKAAEVLKELQQSINLAEFYLAGETGLALILGHRHSRDFDFFNSKLFDEEILIQKLNGLNNLKIISKAESTLHINLSELKVSFLGYNYPLLFQTRKYKTDNRITVNVADERDIACMKISAISSRGTKRDFIDLFVIAQKYSLNELLLLFSKKYSQTPYNDIHLLKSLTYFDDAESEPMADMLSPLSWEKVKHFFISKSAKLL